LESKKDIESGFFYVMIWNKRSPLYEGRE